MPAASVSERRRLVGTVLGVLAFLGGCLILALPVLLRPGANYFWLRSVPGQITHTRLYQSFPPFAEDGISLVYYVDVTFTYSLDGAQKTAMQTVMGESASGDFAYGNALAARYPVGKTVRVYPVLRGDEWSAQIEPRSVNSPLLVVFGFVLAATGVWLVLEVWWSRRDAARDRLPRERAA